MTPEELKEYRKTISLYANPNHVALNPRMALSTVSTIAAKILEALDERTIELSAVLAAYLSVSEQLAEHPDGWDYDCNCQMCQEGGSR